MTHIEKLAREAAVKYAKVKYEGRNKIGHDCYSAEHPMLLETRETKMNAFEAGAKWALSQLGIDYADYG